jgi:hypothetical protein
MGLNDFGWTAGARTGYGWRKRYDRPARNRSCRVLVASCSAVESEF